MKHWNKMKASTQKSLKLKRIKKLKLKSKAIMRNLRKVLSAIKTCSLLQLCALIKT